MPGSRRRRAWTAVAVVLFVAAAVAALLPPRGTPGVDVADLGDALALVLHFGGYAALALSATLAQARPRVLVTGVGLLLYASVLEVIQGLVGQRSLQVQDLVANAAGVAAGVLVGWAIARRP